jgi:hypothetical protein
MLSASVRTVSVFARPGHALEQDVPTGEQPDEQPLDHVLLADDAPGDLAEHLLHERRVGGRHGVGNGRGGDGHVRGIRVQGPVPRKDGSGASG